MVAIAANYLDNFSNKSNAFIIAFLMMLAVGVWLSSIARGLLSALFAFYFAFRTSQSDKG